MIDKIEEEQMEQSREKNDFKLNLFARVEPSDNRNPPLIHYNLNY